MPATRKSPTKSATSALKKSPSRRKKTKTLLLVKYDVGFKNHLFLRGSGANLNWNKGIQMRNIKADEWVWETEASFTLCEFKILINDHQFEIGHNHQLKHGASIEHTPKF
jgi:hypothetical protein